MNDAEVGRCVSGGFRPLKNQLCGRVAGRRV